MYFIIFGQMKEKVDLLRLKDVLREREIAGKDLAKKVGVTPNTISNIISGHTFPGPKLLENIAIALDVDIRTLFRPTKENRSTKDILDELRKNIDDLEEKI